MNASGVRSHEDEGPSSALTAMVALVPLSSNRDFTAHVTGNLVMIAAVLVRSLVRD